MHGWFAEMPVPNEEHIVEQASRHGVYLRKMTAANERRGPNRNPMYTFCGDRDQLLEFLLEVYVVDEHDAYRIMWEQGPRLLQ